ncbi:maker47, partial [Drosophila busckii]
SSEVKFSNAVCESGNQSKLRVYQCRLRAINRHRIDFNYNATLFMDHTTFRLYAQMFKKENGFKPWLFNTTVDICRFFRKPYNPFFIIVYKAIKDYTSFNHTCPYTVSF